MGFSQYRHWGRAGRGAGLRGDIPTMEAVAAASILREKFTDLKEERDGLGLVGVNTSVGKFQS